MHADISQADVTKAKYGSLDGCKGKAPMIRLLVLHAVSWRRPVNRPLKGRMC